MPRTKCRGRHTAVVGQRLQTCFGKARCVFLLNQVKKRRNRPSDGCGLTVPESLFWVDVERPPLAGQGTGTDDFVTGFPCGLEAMRDERPEETVTGTVHRRPLSVIRDSVIGLAV